MVFKENFSTVVAVKAKGLKRKNNTEIQWLGSKKILIFTILIAIYTKNEMEIAIEIISNLFSYLNLQKKGFLSVNVSIIKKLKIIDTTCFGNKKCVIYNIKNGTN